MQPKYHYHPAASVKPKAQPGSLHPAGYAHPTTIEEFEAVYRAEYEHELESCDRWIKWCEKQNDTHGMNFHQGMRSAHVFNNIKTEQLLRVLKQEYPNAASGHNAAGEPNGAFPLFQGKHPYSPPVSVLKSNACKHLIDPSFPA